MFAGHFAVAAGVKAAKDAPPLWSLMLATQLLDVVFVPLYLSGIETIEKVGTGSYGAGLIHADYTHSLVGALVLAGIALAVGAMAWGRRAGWLLGVVTFSHWLIDLLVHRADLPLLPGNWLDLPKLGMGLWQYPYLAGVLELAVVAVGTAIYGVSLYRAAQRKSRALIATAAMGVFLLAALAGDWLGIG